jgi:hypothetical protein
MVDSKHVFGLSIAVGICTVLLELHWFHKLTPACTIFQTIVILVPFDV